MFVVVMTVAVHVLVGMFARLMAVLMAIMGMGQWPGAHARAHVCLCCGSTSSFTSFTILLFIL